MTEFEKLSVLIEARTKKYQSDLAKASKATDDWASDTEKAGDKAETAAKKSEGAFSRISRAIRSTRSEAKKGAEFAVTGNLDESGFSGLMKRIKGVRSEAQKGADFSVRADERGFSGILNRIRGVRAETSKGATMGVTFEQRGAAGVIASGKAVGASMDRLDGRDVTVDINADEKGFSGLKGGLGEVASGIRNVSTVAAASTLPVMIAGVGAGIPTVLALGGSLGGLALNLGKAASGFALVGGVAAGGAYAGLKAYTSLLGSTVTASREAYAATHAHRMEMLEQQRTNILNTEASKRFNEQINETIIRFTKLQAAVGNRVFPMFTKEIGYWNEILSANQGELVDTAEIVGGIATGFSRWFRTAEEGQVFANTLKFINRSAIEGASFLSSMGRAGIGALQPLIPLAAGLQAKTASLAFATQRWVNSAEGQAKLGAVYRGLYDDAKALGPVLMDAARGTAGLFSAIDQAGLADQASAGLARMAAGYAKIGVQGSSARTKVVGFLSQSKALMPFVTGAVGKLAGSVGRIATGAIKMRTEGSKLTILQGIFRGIGDSAKPLERLVLGTFKALGPELATLIPNVVKLAETFAGSTGPLVIFAQTANRLMGAFNSLSPGTKTLVANLVGLKLIAGTLGAGALPGLVGSLASVWVNYRLLRGVGGINDTLRGTGGAADEAAGGVGRLRGGVAKLGLLLAGGIGIAALGVGLVYAYKKNENFRESVNKLGATAGEAFRGVGQKIEETLLPALTTAANKGSHALEDIFDLDKPKVESGASRAANAYALQWGQSISNQAKKQGDEGSAAYEFGNKIGSGITKGAISAINAARSGEGGIQGAIKRFFTGGAGGKEMGGPAKWGSDAGKGFREGIEKVVSGTEWGKARNESLKKMPESIAGWGNKSGEGYERGIIPRIVAAHNKWQIDQKQTGGKIVAGWGVVNKETESAFGSLATTVKNKMGDAKTSVSNKADEIYQSLKDKFTDSEGLSGVKFGEIRDNIGDRLREGKERGSSRIRELGSNLGTSFQNQLSNAQDKYGSIRDNIGDRLRESKERGSSRIAELGSNLGTSFSNQLGNAKDKYSSIRDNIGDRLREGKERGSSRIAELGSNLKTSAANQLANAQDKYSSIRDNIGDRLREGKERGTNRIQELGGNLKNSWSNMLSAVGGFGDKFKNILGDKIGGAVNTARGWLGSLMYGVGSVLEALGAGDLAGKAKGVAGNLKEPMKFARGGITNPKDGPGIVGEAGQREAVVNLEQRTPQSVAALRAANASPNNPEHRHGYTPPGKEGRDWFGAPGSGSGSYPPKAPNFRHSPQTYTASSAASSAAREGAAMWNGLVKQGSGGIQVTRSSQPLGGGRGAYSTTDGRIVYGPKADKYHAGHEFGHTPLGLGHGGNGIMAGMGRSIGGPSSGDFGAIKSYYGGGTPSGSTSGGSSPSTSPYGPLKGRVHDGGEGSGQYGPTANHLWEPDTFGRVIEVLKQFRVSANTYENHPPGYPGLQGKSADFWDYAGRGTPISTTLNNQVRDFVQNKLNTGLSWTLGEGDAGHSGSERHMHATWKGSDPNTPDVKYVGGTGAGDSGFDWMSTILEGLAAVDPFPEIPGMIGQGMAGYAPKLLGHAKDWLIQTAIDKYGDIKDSIGDAYNAITGGGSADQNRALAQEMLAASSVGGSWNSLLQLWNKESGFIETADNPTSDAYGIPQGMTSAHNMPAGYGPPGGDPKVQIGWGLDYIKDRYTTTDSAWGHSQAQGWYEKGGLIPGPAGKHKPVMAAGQEMVIPSGIARPFAKWTQTVASAQRAGERATGSSLANSVELWSKKGTGALQRGSSEAISGGSDRLERVEAAVDRQTDVLAALLDEAPSKTGREIRRRVRDEIRDAPDYRDAVKTATGNATRKSRTHG